jgi:Helix-turn-helix domain
MATTLETGAAPLVRELLNLDEVREVLGGISMETLYAKFLRPNIFPVVRIGRSVKVPAAAIRAYVAANAEPWTDGA